MHFVMPLVEGIFSIGPARAERWHVVVTEPGCEWRVSRGLRDEQVTHYVPREKRWRKPTRIEVAKRRAKGAKRRKLEVVTKPLLPGYVFAALPLADRSAESRVATLRGVAGFLRQDGRPLEVRPIGFVEGLARAEAEGEFDETGTVASKGRGKGDGVCLPAWARVGATVIVNDGPFASFPGVVEAAVDDLVTVAVSIFGRATPVKLLVEQLAPA